MLFKATLRENPILYSMTGFSGTWMLWMGLRFHEVRFTLIGGIIIALSLSLRLLLYVKCTDEYLETRVLFRKRRIAWSQIINVHHAADCGYWASKSYGPFDYHLRTATDCVTINFKFFSRECFREVMARTPACHGKGSGKRILVS